MALLGTTPLLGLDVGSGMIKAVGLKKRGDQLIVEHAGIAATPGGAISGGFLDPPAVSDCIRKLCREQGLRGKHVAVALAGEDVFLARLKVERSTVDTVEAQVREEVARLAPFPLEQASVDFQVLDDISHLKWVDVLVLAARLADLERLQEVLRRAGKTAVVVDSTACALANAFQVNYQPAPSEVTALLHLGAALMTVCILRGSTPLLAKDLALAAGAVSRAPESLTERIAVELERILESMDEIADDRPLEPRSSQVQRLLLSGGGARLRGLEEVLRQRIRLPFEEMNPFLRIDFRTSDALSRLVWDHVHCMPVAVGLALRGLEE